MRQPMRRAAALVATAALAISLSACTDGHWVPEAPPAAGAQADLDGFKLRNIGVIADTTGEAILTGAIASRDESVEVAGISVAAQLEDGSFGEPALVPFSASIPRGKTLLLEGEPTKFTDAELLPGRLAQVQVQFNTGETVALEAPVISSEHPDFTDAWAQVYA